jgi:AraC-like DNA-binding protein
MATNVISIHDARNSRTQRAEEKSIHDSVGQTISEDQHYTPAELAAKWHFSPNTIRRLFEDEAGVMKLTAGPRSTRNVRRRHMVQLRIPARVALRVHARLANS